MPRVRRANRKPPPKGWEIVEDTLMELQAKMREAEAEPHDGKRISEVPWPIFRLHHQRSRYVYEMFYVVGFRITPATPTQKGEISRELYQYLLDEKWADPALIAKWKKSGYENLCCLRCIATNDTHHTTTCICRIPKNRLPKDFFECDKCGCRGCG